jgi:hypothetical protein
MSCACQKSTVQYYRICAVDRLFQVSDAVTCGARDVLSARVCGQGIRRQNEIQSPIFVRSHHAPGKRRKETAAAVFLHICHMATANKVQHVPPYSHRTNTTISLTTIDVHWLRNPYTPLHFSSVLFFLVEELCLLIRTSSR